MIERSLYNYTEMCNFCPRNCERYRKLKKTIAINISNFSLKENQTEEYHTSYHLTEDTYGYSLTNKLELHFIELPKLATQYRLENELNQWMMLLHVVNKDVVNHELIEKLLQIAGGDGIMKRAIQEWETLNKDEDARDEYRARKKAIMDEESRIDNALWNQKIETTERMLNKGVEEKDIIDFLKLTKEEFREIIEQVKDR